MIGTTVRMIDMWNGSKKSLSMLIERFFLCFQRSVYYFPLAV